MPSSEWITESQYVILSRHDKMWADKLATGNLTAETDKYHERDISSWDFCIVGILHNCDKNYGNCKKCDSFAKDLNNQYMNRCFEYHGATQFRQTLGKFLAHYETQHYAKRERDITKCR